MEQGVIGVIAEGRCEAAPVGKPGPSREEQPPRVLKLVQELQGVSMKQHEVAGREVHHRLAEQRGARHGGMGAHGSQDGGEEGGSSPGAVPQREPVGVGDRAPEVDVNGGLPPGARRRLGEAGERRIDLGGGMPTHG